ncbi:HepT-like ribonuclease domain-containing protein [Kribbibacterium absianum]|uniref:HepT-like ribonuclease domain-containing protein n=1 Tax=Kribbibacterium absianum TaxID=3044210 RepID=UPI003D2F8376
MNRYGLTEDSFASSDAEIIARCDSALMPLFVLAEDACHLSESVQNALDGVPWREIRGFRNFVAHGYWELDPRVVWEVATDSAPALAAALEGACRKHIAGGPLLGT